MVWVNFGWVNCAPAEHPTLNSAHRAIKMTCGTRIHAHHTLRSTAMAFKSHSVCSRSVFMSRLFYVFSSFVRKQRPLFFFSYVSDRPNVSVCVRNWTKCYSNKKSNKEEFGQIRNGISYAFVRSIRSDDFVFIVVIIVVIMVESKHAFKRITSTWRLFNVSSDLSVTNSFCFLFLFNFTTRYSH